jgi:hypothetical protein
MATAAWFLVPFVCKMFSRLLFWGSICLCHWSMFPVCSTMLASVYVCNLSAYVISCARQTRPARTTLQQDPSAHAYWESLIAEAKRPWAQNWCCLYRPRRGMSHIRFGYAFTTSFACLTSDWLYSQYLTEPHYHAWARQWLGKKLYCIYTHWLFTQP